MIISHSVQVILLYFNLYFPSITESFSSRIQNYHRNSILPIRKSTDDWHENVPDVNSVSLVGRVGNNPELKRIGDNGNCVLNLSLAVKRKYHPLERIAKGIENEDEEPDWFSLEIWGRDAEYASEYVSKGTRVGVTGGLKIDTWEDKNSGEERCRPKVVVKHFDILESRAASQLR